MLSGDKSVIKGERGAFYNTLIELASYWDHIDVITNSYGAESSISIGDNIDVHNSTYLKYLQPYFILQKGTHLFVKRPYDLIVSHDYGLFLNGLGAKLLSAKIGVPFVSEIHHVDGYPRAASIREKIQPWLTKCYVKYVMSHVVGFRITNSTELEPLMRSWGVSEEQILLLYSLYLDFNVFKPSVSERKYDAIFVGRMTANKGLDLFLESIAEAVVNKNNMRVLVIGNGPLAVSFRNRINLLGLADNIECIDWVSNAEELASYYRSSRCLVCTSFSEGGPRVVAEALACGVPVITTRVGLASQIVEHKVNGYIVDWSSDEIAKVLLEIVSNDNLFESMSSQAPKTVEMYEKERVIKDYVSFYKDLVK